MDFGDLFRAFDDRFGRLVAVFYLSAIPVFAGMLMCIVPGLLLATIWTFVFPLVVVRGLSVSQTFNVSYNVVIRKGFWILFGLNAIMLALHVPGFVPYVGILLSLLVTPLVWGVWISAYVQLVEEDDGSLDDLLGPRQTGGDTGP